MGFCPIHIFISSGRIIASNLHEDHLEALQAVVAVIALYCNLLEGKFHQSQL